LALFRIKQRLLEYQQQLRKPCPPANSSVALPCSGILLGRFSESDGLEQLSINLDQANAVLDALRYAVSANFQAPETVKGLFTTEDCMDAGGTTPRMGEVEQCTEQLPRAPTVGALSGAGSGCREHGENQ
jgi:hypothetical protein